MRFKIIAYGDLHEFQAVQRIYYESFCDNKPRILKHMEDE